METRQLRYFVAVAEELHFGRAARRLGIAQPPLSRAIRGLEDDLGTPLLVRTSRAVALTPSGTVLLREARAALDAVEAAERRVRRSAAGDDRIVVAAKAGGADALLAELLDAYAAQPGAVPVEVVLSGIGEAVQVLRDGRADVAILHRPWDTTAGLDFEELVDEPQVLILPAGHPWGEREHVPYAEAAAVPDLPLPRWPDAGGTYPDGPGAEARDLSQLQQLIALGRASWLAPASARHLLREDLVTVPVHDAPTVTTVIAWPTHGGSAAVADLVRVAAGLSRAAA